MPTLFGLICYSCSRIITCLFSFFLVTVQNRLNIAPMLAMYTFMCMLHVQHVLCLLFWLCHAFLLFLLLMYQLFIIYKHDLGAYYIIFLFLISNYYIIIQSFLVHTNFLESLDIFCILAKSHFSIFCALNVMLYVISIVFLMFLHSLIEIVYA